MTKRVSRLDIILDQMSTIRDAKRIAGLAEEALQLVTREENPLLWAALQASIGSSLVEAAADDFNGDLVARVLASYEAALCVYDPERTPDLWLTTQRNLGATHALALRSHVGDAREHVEAAIAAYEKALELGRRDSALSVWLRCQEELTGMLRVAALWRGPEALVRAAHACEEALQVVTREASPEVWAALKLDLGRCLFESGTASDEVVQQSIRACEDALQVFRAETQPLGWAEANLVLGGAYRMRRSGDRGQNLERATECLNRALSIYTPKTEPEQWYLAHYQRGPAYAFRVHGDRRENQERALESLEITIRGTPCDHAPETWASLQLTLGDVYRQRLAGDPAGNSERAVTALRSARAVLSPGRQPDLWLRASRSLGHAYLERTHDDTGEDLEKAITILEEVQAMPSATDDISEWCATYANLAIAYLQRRRDVVERNRARAIECFEQALTVPVEAWGDPTAWSSVQARMALFLLYPQAFPVARRFGADDQAGESSRTASATDASAQTPQDSKRADGFDLADAALPLMTASSIGAVRGNRRSDDIFDLAGLARQQLASLRKEGATGEQSPDPDWHVPFFLNEAASLLRIEFERFVANQEVWHRTRQERTKLERQRFQLFRLVVAHLVEKYEVAGRSQALFREVEGGWQGFILFLRGFAYRAHHYTGVTIMHTSDVSEKLVRMQLARKLAPIPLLSVANPVDSGPIDALEDRVVGEDVEGETPGLRVEMGSSWETDIRDLISAASFIIVHNPRMTEGVVREIKLIEELGRRREAYFYAPEEAAATLGMEVQDCSPLTEAAVERMRLSTTGRPLAPGFLPAPTCPWVDGSKRARLDFELNTLRSWVERMTGSDASIALDLQLDANMFLLANSLLLERLDLVPPPLLAASGALRSLGEERLEGAKTLADVYASHAERAAALNVSVRMWERM